MKKLIIAGLLAATLTSAQAAPLQWYPNPSVTSGDLRVFIAKGSLIEHKGALAITIKMVEPKKPIEIHHLFFKKEQCWADRTWFRILNVATEKTADSIVVRGEGSIVDHLIDLTCDASKLGNAL